MAKWGDPKDWRVNASRDALDELQGQAFTYGPWEDGTLRFYVNGKVVGALSKEQLPYLIIRAAEVLRK
jgi:hypothetical protein